MAKNEVRLLAVRIPPYRHPRNKWREKIYAAVKTGMDANGINKNSYKKLRLEIRARLYFGENELELHDVDNRLKDIMDALQGRMGGPKKVRKFEPIIPNDKQIFMVSICKQPPTAQSGLMGHLEIREHR
ncbi:MAG: hypothetical protein ACE145_10340 [Terriglobia bacterium]